jgi:hypothetical protein
MIDPLTIMSITFAVISFVDHLLSFTPDGYPKSFIQAIIWVIHKIYLKLARRQTSSHENDDELSLRTVVI